MKNSIVVTFSSGAAANDVCVSSARGYSIQLLCACMLAAALVASVATSMLLFVLCAGFAGPGQAPNSAAAVRSHEAEGAWYYGLEKTKARMDAALYGHSSEVDGASFLDLINFEQNILFSLVPNGMPLNEYRRVSSKFGMRNHPVLRKLRLHKGLDFSVASGAPIYSTAGGVVEVADSWDNSAYGKYVVVRHGLGFTSLYAHMRDVEVKVGDYIDKGALLGFSGNSGRSSSPHLHYEVKYLGRALDPENFIEWSSDNYQAIFSKEKSVPWAALMEKVAQWRSVASAGRGRGTAL